jgi:hypothetical protein
MLYGISLHHSIVYTEKIVSHWKLTPYLWVRWLDVWLRYRSVLLYYNILNHSIEPIIMKMQLSHFMHFNEMQYIALFCIALHIIQMHCFVLKCFAILYSYFIFIYRFLFIYLFFIAFQSNLLYCIAIFFWFFVLFCCATVCCVL